MLFDLRQSKITNLYTISFIYQKIGTFQISVNKHGVAAVQPIHAQGGILGHFHFGVETQMDIRVMKQFAQVTFR